MWCMAVIQLLWWLLQLRGLVQGEGGGAPGGRGGGGGGDGAGLGCESDGWGGGTSWLRVWRLEKAFRSVEIAGELMIRFRRFR